MPLLAFRAKRRGQQFSTELLFKGEISHGLPCPFITVIRHSLRCEVGYRLEKREIFDGSRHGLPSPSC
jgi:hypothetical protein